jgi:acyl carrier protein
MTTQEIQDKVVEIIAKQLEIEKEKVKPETKIAEDLGADSLDRAEMVMDLEDEFDVNIPDDAETKIKTVGDTVAFIEAEMKKKGS